MVRKCGLCDTPVARQEIYLDCNACKKSYHSQCSGLTDLEMETMKKKGCKLKWYCRLCDDHVTDILKNLEKFKKFNEEVKKIQNEVEQKIKNLESRVQKVEKPEENPVITTVIEKVLERKLPTNMPNLDEKMLVEKKRDNLIYFNIPESSSDDIEQRIKHDFECIQEIYGEDVAKKDDISNIFRVGKKSEKARPLVIKFCDGNKKQEYCSWSFGKRLEIKRENEIFKIAVSHDRTPKQREHFQKLVSELNERKESGEEDVVIRNNKIVKNFPNASGGTRTTWASIARKMN